MADGGTVTVYGGNAISEQPNMSVFSIKVSLAQMLRGGAIIEVTNPEQAKIAEAAGACAVVVSEPHRGNGVLRMPDPSIVKEIKRSVSIRAMAKVRVGHFVEAQVLDALGVDYIDENETLTVADEENFINKHSFRCPVLCGCRDLGEALRRVREGAAMIRIQGDQYRSGDVSETVRNVRGVMGSLRVLSNMDDDEVFAFSKKIGAPYDLVAQTKQMGRLPVVSFAAGGIAGPADAALMLQLGCDGVFVGSEVFDCVDAGKRVRAIILAVRRYSDPHALVDAMGGLNPIITE